MDEPIPWRNEYEALIVGAGMAEISGRSRIELRGADRVRFLHSFCTGDIQRLSAGAGCEAFLTNHQGKTVGHVWVFCYEDRLELDAVPDQAADLIAHLDRFVISDDVTFRDATGESSILLVAGPAAEQLLRKLTGAAVPGSLWQHAGVIVGSIKGQIRRIDFLAPASYELLLPAAAVDERLSALRELGAASCGPDAIEAVRLESGMPLYGRDIAADNLPQEVRRDEQAISFTKGCYLGQETVARIDAMGHVNRLLCGVAFVEPQAQVPLAGTELQAGGKVVGHVTSSAWSPRLSQPIALAYLRRPQSAVGTKLESSYGAALVIALPLAS